MTSSPARQRGGQSPDPDRVLHDGVAVPTRGASMWLLVGVATALAAVWVPPTGVIGMLAGSGAHLKGSRWGLPVAGLAAATTIVGMALVFFIRLE